jgi:hypothetical protein
LNVLNIINIIYIFLLNLSKLISRVSHMPIMRHTTIPIDKPEIFKKVKTLF